MLLIVFLLGFLGSFYCMGMCGLIVLVLLLSMKECWGIVWVSGIYNLGRVLIYVFIGLVFGVIGWGIEFVGV